MNKRTTFRQKNGKAQHEQFNLDKAVTCANYMLGLCISEQLPPQAMCARLAFSMGQGSWGERLETILGMVTPHEFDVACRILSQCDQQFETGTVQMGHLSAEYVNGDEIRIGGFVMSAPNLGGVK